MASPAPKSAGGLLISSLSQSDLKTIDDLVDFIRGPGYVLDFSDRTFAQFFASEFGVDIDASEYKQFGTSKGKRLRAFLASADNHTANKVLEALWDTRQSHLASMRQSDPVANAEGRYLNLIQRLKAVTNPGSLPIAPKPSEAAIYSSLNEELFAIQGLAPQRRGYSFEQFLIKTFATSGLSPREPFRNTGEQIDGSFILAGEVYLLEAKWTASPTPVSELHGFHGKLEQKAAWARGLFVSYNGFSQDGLEAFGKGKRIICMDGRDLSDALRRQIPIINVIERKVRSAAETGQAFTPVRQLFSGHGSYGA